MTCGVPTLKLIVMSSAVSPRTDSTVPPMVRIYHLDKRRVMSVSPIEVANCTLMIIGCALVSMSTIRGIAPRMVMVDYRLSTMATPNHLELRLIDSMKGNPSVKRWIWAPMASSKACVMVRVSTKSKESWATRTEDELDEGKLGLARGHGANGPVGAETAGTARAKEVVVASSGKET